MSDLRIVPCSLRKANDFVAIYHRHSKRTARNGGKFAMAIASGNQVIGIAKMDQKGLFPKRKDNNGTWIENNGWEIYRPAAGATQQRGNQQATANDPWE